MKNLKWTVWRIFHSLHGNGIKRWLSWTLNISIKTFGSFLHLRFFFQMGPSFNLIFLVHLRIGRVNVNNASQAHLETGSQLEWYLEHLLMLCSFPPLRKIIFNMQPFVWGQFLDELSELFVCSKLSRVSGVWLQETRGWLNNVSAQHETFLWWS